MEMIGGLMKTTSRFAVAAAAGLFMGGMALTPAQAADLGGDCCADLEERVAELEATTVRKGNRKVSVKLSGQVNRSLLIWDGAVWHAGGANHSADLRRRSINLNFNLSWLRQQENQYIGIPREVVLAMPERLQRLLGYNKVNHLCGGVAYQDPLDYFRYHRASDVNLPRHN